MVVVALVVVVVVFQESVLTPQLPAVDRQQVRGGCGIARRGVLVVFCDDPGVLRDAGLKSCAICSGVLSDARGGCGGSIVVS